MNIGCHISIAGGFDKCVDRIVERGGNCLMTFASSPRSLQTKQYSQAEIDAYLKKKAEFKIGPHFFHGVYLVNLATPKADYLQVSIDSLVFYQKLASAIGGVGTIFHTGSTTSSDWQGVKKQIVDALKIVLDQTPYGVKLFLENCAGQGGAVGDTLEELADLLNDLSAFKDKLSICLDTQHLFAAGYNLNEALDQFDKLIGLKWLGVIHLNDSKTEFGSRVDRHENLGLGKIGAATLKKFVSDVRLANIPIILEVPGNGEGPRKQDIDSLKSMII